LSKEAQEELLAADKFFSRTGAHPVYEWLEKQGRHVACFDRLYDLPWKQNGEVYEFMVSALLKEAELHGKATFAFREPGISGGDYQGLAQTREWRWSGSAIDSRPQLRGRSDRPAEFGFRRRFASRSASRSAANTCRNGTLHDQAEPSGLPN
jgi:hypothetical protein